MSGGVGAVHFLQQRQRITVRLRAGEGIFFVGEQIGHRLRQRGIDDRSLMPRREEAGAEVSFLIVRKSARVGEHDEVRQILREAAERVGNPRAHAGESWQDESGIHHEAAGAVDIRLALHGHEEGHFVHPLGLLGKHAAHPATALPMLLKLEGALHHRAAVAGLSFGPDFWPYHLSVQPRQLRLVVERVHLTDAAIHEELNDALDLRRMMEPARQPGAGGHGVPREHLREREAGHAAAGLPEKLAAVEEGVVVVCGHGQALPYVARRPFF